MSTTTTPNVRRGGHGQAARILTIAVATAALAGAGAAAAADGGGKAAATKAKAAAEGAESLKAAPKTADPGPLDANEPIVTQARTRLERLVADGTIDQAEVEAVMRSVIAGSVDPEALVRAGDVSSPHMPAMYDVLLEVKRDHTPDPKPAAGP
jgi:hypothetical protein